jgi:hypothetical protein
MNRITILLLILFIGFNSFAQKPKPQDTSEICIPYGVAQKMLLDLNDYDRLKEINKLNEKQIIQLNDKVFYMEKSISSWQKLDSTNKILVSNTEQKFKIMSDENERLRKEFKKHKVKSTFIQVDGGSIILTLTGLLIF